MNRLGRCLLAVAGLAAVVFGMAGCSAAYHRYENGCVPCRACPLAPLPFTHYSNCGCPDVEEY